MRIFYSNDTATQEKNDFPLNSGKILEFISLLVTFILLMSFTYLFVYLSTLGVQIGKLPITIDDFVMTFKNYMLAYLLQFVTFISGCFIDGSPFENNKTSHNLMVFTNKYKTPIYILFIIITSISYLAFFAMPVEYDKLILLPLIMFAISILSICIVNGIIYDKLTFFCFVIFFASFLYIVYEARYSAITNYTSQEKTLKFSDKEYIPLYTFEKGFLILDGNIYKFIYLDGKTSLDVGQNKLLMKFKESLGEHKFKIKHI